MAGKMKQDLKFTKEYAPGLPAVGHVLPPFALYREEEADEGVFELFLVLQLVSDSQVVDQLLGQVPDQDLDVGQDLGQLVRG